MSVRCPKKVLQKKEFKPVRLVQNLEANQTGWRTLSLWIEKQKWEKVERLSLLFVAEEIFTNIMKFAYDGEVGPVRVVCLSGDEKYIQFRDWGKPFNPLKSIDPNVLGTVKERQIGGLGLYLVKKMVETLTYARRHKQNILTLRLK